MTGPLDMAARSGKAGAETSQLLVPFYIPAYAGSTLYEFMSGTKKELKERSVVRDFCDETKLGSPKHKIAVRPRYWLAGARRGCASS